MNIYDWILFGICVLGAILVGLYASYGAVWRPLLGLLTGQDHLISRDVDSMELFKFFNNGKEIKSMADLNNAQVIGVQYIKARSYFQNDDMREFMSHARNVMHIMMLQNRFRTESEWRNNSRPQQRGTVASGWRLVLGVSSTETNTSVIKANYRKLSKIHHPDHGGNKEKMQQLNEAIAAARKELNFV